MRYPVPDTQAKLYKVHGQVDMSLNKKPRTTILSDIFDRAKHPSHKRPGPSEYKTEQALDYAKTHSTKRYQWNKLKRSSILDEVQQREKKLKGPADYSPEVKVKIHGHYNSNVPTGQMMSETDYLSK